MVGTVWRKGVILNRYLKIVIDIFGCVFISVGWYSHCCCWCCRCAVGNLVGRFLWFSIPSLDDKIWWLGQASGLLAQAPTSKKIMTQLLMVYVCLYDRLVVLLWWNTTNFDGYSNQPYFHAFVVYGVHSSFPFDGNMNLPGSTDKNHHETSPVCFGETTNQISPAAAYPV